MDSSNKMLIKKGQTYRHFRGRVYIVIDMATHAELYEAMVIYSKVGGDSNNLFVRSVSSFIGDVHDRLDNVTGQIRRFEEFKIEEMLGGIK